MIPALRNDDWSTILHFSGAVFFFLGVAVLLPVIIALFTSEWSSAVDFFFTATLLFLLGGIFYLYFRPKKDAGWLHGMCITAFSWIISMLILAIPYYLSPHFLSYLDACFDVMSGLTTTGLVLIQDIDHLPLSMNLWRHFLTYLGGQGIIIVAVAFIPSIGVNFKAMVGEGKEERLSPNIKHTGRFIWLISFAFLVIGTLILFLLGLHIGLKPGWSLFHGLSMFMSTWSTGGFAPQSINALYYHNVYYEVALTVFSIVGSMNFGLHYYMWFKNRKAIFQDIETRAWFVSVVVLFMIMTSYLIRQNLYPSTFSLFRKALFILISGHTTTGTQTIYSAQFLNLWPPMVLICLIVAMSIGGSSASTAGGFKGIRMGILFKSIIQDVKQFFLPSHGVSVATFHHIGKQVLNDKMIKSTISIVLLYILFYVLGAILGVAYGYPAKMALFDSVSAGSNTGLSTGLVSASMPSVMKVYFILSMFLGRVEFFSVLIFITFLVRYITQRAIK
jgi:trk system potassium uptake protein